MDDRVTRAPTPTPTAAGEAVVAAAEAVAGGEDCPPVGGAVKPTLGDRLTAAATTRTAPHITRIRASVDSRLQVLPLRRMSMCGVTRASNQDIDQPTARGTGTVADATGVGISPRSVLRLRRTSRRRLRC